MNLRCSYCQTPFTIGRAQLLAALQHMSAENLHHYDAHCPRCRKANSVARQRMEMVFPNWKQAAQEQAELAATPAPVAQSVPEPVKVEPVAEAAPKTKKPATKKPAAKKTAPKVSSDLKVKKSPTKAKKK
jgi:ssDNA-binding Zn-finger/Zn-ribbon topoisomerase 1